MSRYWNVFKRTIIKQKMTAPIDLKKCPLCENHVFFFDETKSWDYVNTFSIRCPQCNLQMRLNNLSRDEMFKKWNTRSEHLAEKILKKLVETIDEKSKLLENTPDWSTGKYDNALLKAKEYLKR